MKRLLYLAARIFGDVNAVKKGRAGRRLGRRIVGRGTRKMARKLFK